MLEQTDDGRHPIGPFSWTPASISLSVPALAACLMVVQAILDKSLIDAALEWQLFVAVFVVGLIYGVAGLWGGLANRDPRKATWAAIGIISNLCGLLGCALFRLTGGFSPGV